MYHLGKQPAKKSLAQTHTFFAAALHFIFTSLHPIFVPDLRVCLTVKYLLALAWTESCNDDSQSRRQT